MTEIEWWEYDDAAEMADALAGDIQFIIESALDARGQAVIALAGRPLGPDVIGSGGDELVASGLAVVVAGEVGPRHGLIAETAAGILDEEERRRAHRHLAERIEDPGEAARHHAAAGEPAEAFAKALAAADRASAPGERASHLEGPGRVHVRRDDRDAGVLGAGVAEAELARDVDLRARRQRRTPRRRSRSRRRRSRASGRGRAAAGPSPA